MKPQTYEEKLLVRIEESSEKVKVKYFKQFCQAQTDIERNNIGARMDVLESVLYDLTKSLKSGN